MRFNTILGIEGVEWIEGRMSHDYMQREGDSKYKSLMKIKEKLFSKVVFGKIYT